MGEYTGRRRGRAASEPTAQQPEYYGYPPEYTQEPGYGYQEAPSYEQPAYEQQPGYEQQGYYQGYQEPYYQDGYQQTGYEQEPYAEHGYGDGHSYAPTDTYAGPGYADGYPDAPYVDDYSDASYADGYSDAPYANGYPEVPYADGYAEAPYADGYSDASYADGYSEAPYAEGYSNAPYADGYSDAPYSEAPAHTYAASGYADDHPEAPFSAYTSPEPHRTPLPLISHLPFAGAATVALAVAAFVSAKAVAAVVLPLQVVVAWAVLDLTGFASRRTAVLAALPVLAGTIATFKFQPDDAAVPVAAGLGAGFVLVAADAVFRARRRGVEPGAVQSLAAAVSALLFAGLTGLFLPAAVLHAGSVAVGAAVCGLVSLLAARNRELAVSRAAVVAIPVTIAALAAYAAAILVP